MRALRPLHRYLAVLHSKREKERERGGRERERERERNGG